MLDGISSRAWSEWQAFWHLYGFGEKRMDVRFAQLAAQIINLVRSKDSPPVSIDDLLPDENGEDEDGEYGEGWAGESTEAGEIVDEDQLIFEASLREAIG